MVGKIKNKELLWSRERLHSAWVNCTQPAPPHPPQRSPLKHCKRISDANGEIEARAGRTKRMRYQRGFQGRWVLFYTDALDGFYSKHTDALACWRPREGERASWRENKNPRVAFEVSWGSCFYKCRYEFLTVAVLSNEVRLWTSRFFYFLFWGGGWQSCADSGSTGLSYVDSDIYQRACWLLVKVHVCVCKYVIIGIITTIINRIHSHKQRILDLFMHLTDKPIYCLLAILKLQLLARDK